MRCPARQGASSSDPRPCHFRMGRRTDYARTGQSSLPGVSGSSCARRNVFALNGLFTPILHRRATGAPPAGQHRTRRPPRPGGSLLLRSSRRIRRSREDFCRARFDSSTRYFVQLFVQLVSDCGLGRRIGDLIQLIRKHLPRHNMYVCYNYSIFARREHHEQVYWGGTLSILPCVLLSCPLRLSCPWHTGRLSLTPWI